MIRFNSFLTQGKNEIRAWRKVDNTDSKPDIDNRDRDRGKPLNKIINTSKDSKSAFGSQGSTAKTTNATIKPAHNSSGASSSSADTSSGGESK